MPDIENRHAQVAYYQEEPGSERPGLSLLQQAILEAQAQGLEHPDPQVPDTKKGLNPAAAAAMWGGAATDLGSTYYKLQDPRFHELHPIMAGGGPLGMLALKLGTNGLTHYALNKYVQNHPEKQKLANILAVILGAGQAGIGIHNLTVKPKM